MRTLIYIMLVLLFSLTKRSSVLKTEGKDIPKQIMARESVQFHFENIGADSRLLMANSFGKTILKPQSDKNGYFFEIPAFISRKSGIVHWKLQSSNPIKEGKLEILPLSKPETIENYFGPRSIQAGARDYSMLVSIPTDEFGNPLSDNTEVSVSEYFRGQLMTDTLKTQDMFAWKNSYSKEESGKIIVSNSCKNIQAKEMISLVYPSTPVDFNIAIDREHDYADGNQVAEVKTSKIKDAYGNVVSDGTIVDFIIENESGSLLKSLATTIDGVAVAKVLHPERPEKWKIKATITGMAESDEILINFESAVQNFEVQWNKNNKKIIVGPIRSFLNQFIPDGAEVSLQVYDLAGELQYEMKQPTDAGFATFQLSEADNYQDSAIFKIEALGITKSIQ